MSAAMQTMGVNAFRDTLKNGGCVASLLNDLYIDATQGTTDIFVGAVVCLLSTYTAVRDAGLVQRRDGGVLNPLLHYPRSGMWSASLQVDRGPWSSSIRLDTMVRQVVAHRAKLRFPDAPGATSESPAAQLCMQLADMECQLEKTINHAERTRLHIKRIDMLAKLRRASQ